VVFEVGGMLMHEFWLAANNVRKQRRVFYVRGSMHREPMSIIVQQDVTLYSFYSLQTAEHVSGDIFTHHQEHE
jgi:hypothetical protein